MLLSLFSGEGITLISVLSAIASSILIVFLCWPVREYVRGFVAVKLGDPTPKYSGRLSLNPLVHIDPIGAIAIVLFGIGWGRGEFINPRNFTNRKRDTAIVAFSGIFANVILAFVFYVILKVVGLLPYSNFTLFIQGILYLTVAVNLSLAAFHLIPIPPLDASAILPIIMSNNAYYRLMQYSRYFPLILLVLIATDVLSYPMYYISNFFYFIFDILTFWIG